MENVLVINQFSSSKYLSDILTNNNIQSTALYTVDFSKTSDYLRPQNKLFPEQIILPDANIDNILSSLNGINFDYIICGSEGFVHTTDLLASVLTPQYANNPLTSSWRDDKLAMHQRLSDLGLSHIKQFKVTKANYLSGAKEYQFPMFIKPLNGAGSIGALAIHSLPELDVYLETASNINSLGHHVENFVLSELVNGDEYMIDCFSNNGSHHIATIQKYQKENLNGFPKYLSCEVESDQNKLEKITKYVCDVLNATEFNNGFSHIECFYTKDAEVKLIEINPRISGMQGFCHILANNSGQLSQIDIMLSEIFSINTSDVKHSSFAKMLFLYNGGHNIMPNLDAYDLSEYGVCSLIQLIKPGAMSNAIISSASDAAAVVIVSAISEDQLLQRIDLIRKLDDNNWKF